MGTMIRSDLLKFRLSDVKSTLFPKPYSTATETVFRGTWIYCIRTPLNISPLEVSRVRKKVLNELRRNIILAMSSKKKYV